MELKQFETNFCGRKLNIQIGKLAGQASGAATVSYGETVVLVTATISNRPREDIDFFPFVVDFEERFYAAGKILGSRFIKREGRPSEKAILTARLIDRSLRPLFPKDFRNEVQVIVTVLSIDGENDPSIISLIGASIALMIGGAPLDGPVGALRVGYIDDKLILNPTIEQLEKSDLDLVVAGTKNKIVMIEAGAKEVSEEKIIEAVDLGHKELISTISLQEEIIKKLGIKKLDYIPKKIPEEILKRVEPIIKTEIENIFSTSEKKEQSKKFFELKEKIIKELGAKDNLELLININLAFEEIIRNYVREILKKGLRVDKRQLNEIRPISIEVGLLPRTHGSALFTRGQTQVLSTTTLGSLGEEQVIETMTEETTKRFMHHYSFPPFSSGEIKPLKGPSRREIGHGSLVEKALSSVIPDREKFPYTIRVASEVLSSNGSTSMAATCASCLSLMDAGVPIYKSIAGIAMGLLVEKEGYKILTDITGLEDAMGDMDFKVAGSRDGVTALQLDIKIPGISLEILKEALNQAREARLKILDEMDKVLSRPRKELSKYAPRVTVLKINPLKIKDVIGPSGRVINEIINKTNVSIDIEEDGTIRIFSADPVKLAEATKWIKNLTREVAVGEVFKGKVTRITGFGAFVEILPGIEGLVHISQLSDRRINRVEEIVKVGDVIPVVVIEIDSLGRINLSHKAALGLEPTE